MTVTEYTAEDFEHVVIETLCPRTLALWKPGETIAGIGHVYVWTGSLPCTGMLRCYLCGQLAA